MKEVARIPVRRDPKRNITAMLPRQYILAARSRRLLGMWILEPRRGKFPHSENPGGLNGSMQHLPKVLS